MAGNPPEQWRSHTGPSNWYDVLIPNDWNAEEDGNALRLSSAGDSSGLELRCGWIADAPHGDLFQLVDLAEYFTEVRKVRHRQFDKGPHEALLIEGECLREGAHGWLKRLRAKNWQPWKIWVVRHKSVLWFAILSGETTDDLQAEFVARRVVKSLKFAATPAEPPEKFATSVLQLAQRKFPLLKCQLQGDFQIQLGDSRINLFNFYRSYSNAPENFERIVLPALTTVVRVQEWGDDQTEPPLDSVANRIFPMLYPRAVWEESFPNFVGQEWIADLMILYVVDENNAYWYIRDDLLDRWSLSPDDLHEMALKNLDRYFSEKTMEFTGLGQEDGAMIVMPTRPDAYNSARVLSEAFHRKLRELLGREFAVGVPSRDFFVAVNLNSEEVLDHVREKVSKDFSQMDHPLTERLLLVSADGVSEYVEV